MVFAVVLAAALGSQQPEEPIAIPPASRPIIRMGEVNGWALWDNTGSCAAVTEYGERGVTVRVSYFPTGNDAFLWVSDPAWRTIQDNGVYRVTVLFDNGSEYADVEAEGMVRTQPASTALMIRLNAREFLQDFAAANRVGLFMDDDRLGVFLLDGTAEMVSRLRMCAEASARRNPPDPFLNRTPIRRR
ncbi:hypothetical protein [Allosphingosinicella sp.]|jgi:hypothetical protein|uniref:hypothetical protein n=1 Tax=Allosphingosinicella sp. TaxID=2823234 RepID=UPI002F043668